MSTTLPNPFDLTGHIALVTSATKGMGWAIAAILAQAGARIAPPIPTLPTCKENVPGPFPQPQPLATRSIRTQSPKKKT